MRSKHNSARPQTSFRAGGPALLKMALFSVRKARECWRFIRALHKGPAATLAPQVTRAGLLL